MGQPAAKQGDTVQAVDTHIVMIPSPGGPVPTPVPGHPFNGIINGGLSSNVRITANNQPPHIPIGGPSFQIPPTNQGTIITGSATVRINGQPAARNGDTANTCNDPAPLPVGTVIAVGTVMIGG
jgi:uncharacterized Zn-binding protein involved in type VI secretion